MALEGKAARRESARRLHLAEVASNKSVKPDPYCKRPIRAYLTELGQHLKQKGRGTYHTADKWLAEKLAKRGYSKDAIRRTLLRASPELLNQHPSQRQSYVRRLVDRIQGKVQQQQTKKIEAQKKLEKPDKSQVPNTTAIIRDGSVSRNPKMWKFLAEKAGAALLIKNTAKEAAKKSTEQAVKNNAAKKVSDKEMRELTDKTLKSTMKDKGTKVETAPKKITDKSPEAKPAQDTGRNGKDNNPFPKDTREHGEFKELMAERASRLDKIFEQGKDLKGKDPDDLTNVQHYRQKISQVKDKIDKDLSDKDKSPMSKKDFDHGMNKKVDLEVAKAMRSEKKTAEEIKEAVEKASPEAGILPKDMREPYAVDVAKKAEEWWGQAQNQRQERSLYRIDLPPQTPNFTPDIER